MNESIKRMPEELVECSDEFMHYLKERMPPGVKVTYSYWEAVIRFEAEFCYARNILGIISANRNKYRAKALKTFEKVTKRHYGDIAVWQNGNLLIVDVPLSTRK